MLLLLLLLAGCTHSAGPAEGDSSNRSFRVNGASMVPTLVGRFRQATCKRCRVRWLIEPAPASGEARSSGCRLCGDRLEVDPVVNDMQPGPNASLANSSARQDVITIESMVQVKDTGGTLSPGTLSPGTLSPGTLSPGTLSPGTLSPGDLVAARWGGAVHVKRIVAADGDTVTLQKSRLIVNGARIEDSLHGQPLIFPTPWIIVDCDPCRDRSQTRWRALDAGTGDDSFWQRTSAGRWKIDSGGGREWLAYHHRSVDRGKAEAPVRDGYPFNVSAARRLFDVDRLRVSGMLEANSRRELEVAFWSQSGPVVARTSVEPGQTFNVSFYDGEPSDTQRVNATRPCAMRVVQGDAALVDLMIERHVEYRLRPHDDSAAYPRTLGPNEFFLLGDNVPLSVDSRDVGAIAASQIIGRVIQREPIARKMLQRLP